jgi:hypothetical protein
VAGHAWSKNPESYAGGSRVSHTGQVKDDDPDEKGYTGPPRWEFGVRPTTSPSKNVYVEKPSKMPRMGLINRRRSGFKEKGFIFGTWNVRTLFKTGALTYLPSQFK